MREDNGDFKKKFQKISAYFSFSVLQLFSISEPVSLQPAQLDQLSVRVAWEDLDPAHLRDLIRSARAEDLEGAGLVARLHPSRPGDPTTESLFESSQIATAHIVGREGLTACGLPLIELILAEYGAGGSVDLNKADGDTCAPGETLARISATAAVLLQAERVLLNFLQRLSGIATQTSRYTRAIGRSRPRILDTRKTTPGWRMLEKYAVARGGGWNHRLGLFDRIMIKDNHLAATGAGTGSCLSDAVRKARASRPDLVVEVEVDTLDQLDPVLDAGADVVLLDNFSDADLLAAMSVVAGRAATEASGGISIERLPRLANLGLDFISCGALVHQSTWVDIALDWDEPAS